MGLQEVAGKYPESTLNPALATKRITLDRQAPEKGLPRWFLVYRIPNPSRFFMNLKMQIFELEIAT